MIGMMVDADICRLHTHEVCMAAAKQTEDWKRTWIEKLYFPQWFYISFWYRCLLPICFRVICFIHLHIMSYGTLACYLVARSRHGMIRGHREMHALLPCFGQEGTSIVQPGSSWNSFRPQDIARCGWMQMTSWRTRLSWQYSILFDASRELNWA